MARLSGSLLTYLQSAWALGTVALANIRWSEDWFNPKYLMGPQITITDVYAGRLQSYSTAGSYDFHYNPSYAVNVWVPVKTGNVGTQEAQNAQDMRLEVARVFREGVGLGYGGSLAPFGVVKPEDAGRPLHELDSTPRLLRYEITLRTTRWNE